MSASPGLGTRLRCLLADLDGAVQAEYDRRGAAFRPKYHPVVRRLLARPAESTGALAASAGVSQPAMTQTLREMTRAGLVAVAPGVHVQPGCGAARPGAGHPGPGVGGP